MPFLRKKCGGKELTSIFDFSPLNIVMRMGYSMLNIIRTMNSTIIP